MGTPSNVVDLAAVWSEAWRDNRDPLASEKKMASVLIWKLRQRYVDGREGWRYIEGDSATEAVTDFAPVGCFAAYSVDDMQDSPVVPSDIDAVFGLCHFILEIEAAPTQGRAVVLAKQISPILQWAREQCGLMQEPFGMHKIDTPTKREILIALEGKGCVDTGRSVDRNEAARLIDDLNVHTNNGGAELVRNIDNIKKSFQELRRDGMILTSGERRWMKYFLSSRGISIARYIARKERNI